MVHAVGVVRECDYPRSIENLPRLTAGKTEVAASSAGIDAGVTGLSDEGGIYTLDAGCPEEWCGAVEDLLARLAR